MNVGKNDFVAIKNDFIPNTTIIRVMGPILREYEQQQRTISEDEFCDMRSKWYWSTVISEDRSIAQFSERAG